MEDLWGLYLKHNSSLTTHECVFKGTELAYSDTKEELFVFAEILKLVPTFKEVLSACCDH